jgi:hypothetical protein
LILDEWKERIEILKRIFIFFNALDFFVENDKMVKGGKRNENKDEVGMDSMSNVICAERGYGYLRIIISQSQCLRISFLLLWRYIRFSSFTFSL